MRTSVWHGSAPVLVSLHGPTFPTDEEWDRHMTIAGGMRAELGDGGLFRVLVFSDGGGPTSAQRARLVGRAGRRLARGALITTSRTAAGIGTVMSLTYPGVKIFEPRELPRALAHLEILHGEVPALLEHVRAADAGLGLECIAELITPAGAA